MKQFSPIWCNWVQGFVQGGNPSICTSFPAGSYESVQGDSIYFIDKYKKDDQPSYVTTVYNMRDGTVKPFTAELLSGNPAEDKLASPVWMFPPE